MAIADYLNKWLMEYLMKKQNTYINTSVYCGIKKFTAQCALFDGLVIYPIHTNIKEKQQCEHVSW